MADPTATPLSTTIELRITGRPDVKNRYGSGSIRPDVVFIYYLTDRTNAHVYGSWVREDGEPTDAPVDQLYRHDDTWPDWLTELAREHRPAASHASVFRQAADAVASDRDYQIPHDGPLKPGMDRAEKLLRRMASGLQEQGL